MAKILAAASMYGGAEAILPAISKLRASGNDVRTISFYAGTGAFQNRGLEPDQICGRISFQVCVGEMRKFKPDFILTGTQFQDERQKSANIGNCTLEQMLWVTAKKFQVPSLAVMDTWGNYAERFSGLDIHSETSKLAIIREKRLAYLPTKIAVPDSFAKREMALLGFPEGTLEVTGSPHHERIAENFAKLPASTRAELLDKPVFSSFDKNGKIIVFISDDWSAYPNIGFTEKGVLQSFLSMVNKMSKETGLGINVIVRPHPFRNGNAADAFNCKTGSIAKVLHNPAAAKGTDKANEYSIEQLFKAADLVVGTFNEPLLQARMVGKPAIHYAPNFNAKYELQSFLHKEGRSTLVTMQSKIGATVMDVLDGNIHQKALESVRGATSRVAELLLGLVIPQGEA